MKRKIALFLSMIMLIAVLIPANAFAGADKELEKAINIAKVKFTIPAALTEFSYNINTDGKRKVWSLSWNSKDEMEGNLNISVDDHGKVTSYSYYKPIDYSQRMLPKVTKKDARVKAEEFIKIANPDIFNQLKLVENYQSMPVSTEYYFNFIRMVNGIPFPDNTVNVSINSQTGDVQYYYCTWTDDAVFPESSKAIAMGAAQNAYEIKLGLRLQYNFVNDIDNPRVFASYSPKYNYGYYIDALTGEKIQLSPYYGVGGRGGDMGFYDMKAANTEAAMPQTLTPQELKAIEEVSKLISQDQAEKIARSIKELELTADFKLTNASLNRDWMFKKNYNWNINFSKEETDKTKQSMYANATIDAITGEVKSFYRGFPYNSEAVPKFDEDASRKAVETFLKEFMPNKYNDLMYEENTELIFYKKLGKVPQQQYNFTYTRKVNGVPFPGNTVTVAYDAVNGKITNFYTTWYDMSFPPVDKAMSLDKAYEKMFSDIGLELQYKVNYSDDMFKGIITIPDAKDIKLVYAVKTEKPLILDANTGVILNYNGQPFKENKPVEYTDITGHFAEKQITALAEHGISLEGTQFKPDENIIQADFFRLLVKVLNYYGPMPVDKDKELDEIYKFLIREKIVRDGEKSVEASVTREDAVKFLIRALKYDKVADIKDIYKSSFKDSDKINPDLLGYVVIAKGLNIINGNAKGYFLPKNKLTRAEAATIIYNYLQK